MADFTFEPQIIRFADFELDVGSGELRKSGGDPVLLAEQPFRILATLIRQSGNLVTRDELRRELWPEDTFVDFEHSLNAAIKRLRVALGDSATDPRFIQTIPRRGYRFIVPSETITHTSPVEPPAPVLENASVSKRHIPRWWPALGGLAVLVIVALAYPLSQTGLREATPPEIHSIAVLPLRNLSKNPDHEYLADGLTEALSNSLGQMALRVVTTASVVRFKGSNQPLSEIARQLKVDAILDASLQVEKSRVKIIIQLVRGGSDTAVWSEDFERELTDILTLQKDVAHAIASEIRTRLTPEQQTRIASARSVNPEAYQAYLKGRYHLRKAIVEDFQRAKAQFERAIQIDPDYAPAWAGLSNAWWQLGRNVGLKEAKSPAREAAQKALELDDRLAEAHVAQGYLKAMYDWDWKGGENSLIRAIELDPNSLDAHIFYARLLEALGRFSEAIALIQRAEQLDPLSAAVQQQFGSILFRAGRLEEAVVRYKAAIDLEPRKPMPYELLGAVYEHQRKYDDAISLFKKARDVRGFSQPGHPVFNSLVASVYARTGRESEARQILKTLKDSALPGAHAALGDKDEAFRLLFKMVERKDDNCMHIKTDPGLASLHSDSRWNKLLGQMNLSVESVAR